MFLQVSGARILMSSECEAILLEQEANKETKEKEKRKLKRERREELRNRKLESKKGR